MTGTRRYPHADSPAVGRQLAGRYRVGERIGQGGMAEVYRATDEALGREVALKIFRPEYASAEDLVRQQGEVRLLAMLSHPSLVTLYDVIADDDGRVVLVLEFVPGTDARHRLHDGPIDRAAVAAIGADVARALAFIHSQGVIHRDVSPANILLPDSPHAGAAKLTDLGIARLVDEARLTATGSVTGTAGYMSPEQVAGRRLTSATDTYSLGLVLLEGLTGHREFQGSAVEAAAARLARDPEIPAELGATWGHLLREMTARDPERRPTAHEVAARLSRLAAHAAGPAVDTRVDTQATARMAPAAGSDSRRSARATRVMAATETAPSPTRVLAAPETAPSPSLGMPDQAPTLARRRSRPRTMLLVVAGVAAVAAIIVTFTVLPAATHPAPDPISSYPAVGGQLGEHLRQLEHQVSTRTSP
jgi:serine/threonine protein kinase